jgi:hypothetical protein
MAPVPPEDPLNDIAEDSATELDEWTQLCAAWHSSEWSVRARERLLAWAQANDSLATWSLCSALAQLPPPADAMELRILMDLALAPIIEERLLWYIGSALGEQVRAVCAPATDETLVEQQEHEPTLAAMRASAARLTQLPASPQRRLLDGDVLAPATALVLLVLAPASWGGLCMAGGEVDDGGEVQSLRALVSETWRVRTTAWLEQRWASQQAFEDSDVLGLFTDGEEFPSQVRAGLPFESPSSATPEQASAWETSLPRLLQALLVRLHGMLEDRDGSLLAKNPEESESSGLSIAAPLVECRQKHEEASDRVEGERPQSALLPPLCLADFWADGGVHKETNCTAIENNDGEGPELHTRTACAGSTALLDLLLERGTAQHLHQLQSLDLSACLLGDATTRLLCRTSQRCKHLNELWMRGLSLDAEGRCLAAIATLRHLRLLALGGCRGIDEAHFLKFLTSLPESTMHTTRRHRPCSQQTLTLHSSIERQRAQQALQPDVVSGASITHLEVRGLVSLSDATFDAIATSLRGLRELSAYGCRRLTDNGLAALSGLGCPNMRWLNVCGAYKVSDAAMQSMLASHSSLLLYNKPHMFGAQGE